MDYKSYIIRVSSSIVRYFISFQTTGVTVYAPVGELSGIDLTTAVLMKLTGTEADPGALNNDIVLKISIVNYQKAAF